MRDAKLEWQLHRQPGTVGSDLLKRTQHVCKLFREQIEFSSRQIERNAYERDKRRWGRDAGDGKASGSEPRVRRSSRQEECMR